MQTDKGPFFVIDTLVYSKQPQRPRRGSPEWCNLTSISVNHDPRDMDGRPLDTAASAQVAVQVAIALNAHDELMAALKDLADRFAYAAADDEDDAAALDRARAALKKAGAL